MKFTALALALVAAAVAPLASAQPQSTCQDDPTGANALLLGNLTITASIKRTSVKGGSRIVQTISIRNNNAAATRVRLLTAYNQVNTLIKGTARAPGSKAVRLVSSTVPSGGEGGPIPVITTPLSGALPDAISIPSGKTLKATGKWSLDDLCFQRACIELHPLLFDTHRPIKFNSG